MNVPAIYRIVTNGSRYAIQRKESVMSDWEFCTYFVATSDFSGMWVPFEYLFKWVARWKMCRLMLEEHERMKKAQEKWTEVDVWTNT